MPQPQEIDILARTLIGEDDNEQGQIAIAHVVHNRIAVAKQHGGTYWWGNDIVSVCLKPYQFSTWLDTPNDHLGDNFRRMMSFGLIDDPYARAYHTALGVMLGRIPDPTGGATHYHSMYSKRPSPDFDGLTLVGQFGKNIFYRM